MEISRFYCWKSKLFGNKETQAAHDLNALICDSIGENPSFVLVPQSLKALLHTTSSGHVTEYLFSHAEYKTKVL